MRLLPAGGGPDDLFKDVASDYRQMVTVPEQLPVVLDRAMRIAAANRTVTAIIIPSDVQDLESVAAAHEFKMAPGSIDSKWATPAVADDTMREVADLLNSGSKVAMLVGSGARDARAEVEPVADLIGAGVAKALLGKDVLSDKLAYVTGSIGLLGTKASYDLMMGCDTLLTVGSSFPYTQFMPEFDKAGVVQFDIDPVELFVDANGGYGRKQAIRVMQRAADLDVQWSEEPVSDDLDGLREVRDAVWPDVTAGEYGYDLYYFRRMCESGAVDCLHSLHAHVAAATPNLRHLEWFHDHVRIETMFFDGTLDPQGGTITPDPHAPGNGLTLRDADAAPFRKH